MGCVFSTSDGAQSGHPKGRGDSLDDPVPDIVTLTTARLYQGLSLQSKEDGHNQKEYGEEQPKPLVLRGDGSVTPLHSTPRAGDGHSPRVSPPNNNSFILGVGTGSSLRLPRASSTPYALSTLEEGPQAQEPPPAGAGAGDGMDGAPLPAILPTQASPSDRCAVPAPSATPAQVAAAAANVHAPEQGPSRSSSMPRASRASSRPSVQMFFKDVLRIKRRPRLVRFESTHSSAGVPDEDDAGVRPNRRAAHSHSGVAGDSNAHRLQGQPDSSLLAHVQPPPNLQSYSARSMRLYRASRSGSHSVHGGSVHKGSAAYSHASSYSVHGSSAFSAIHSNRSSPRTTPTSLTATSRALSGLTRASSSKRSGLLSGALALGHSSQPHSQRGSGSLAASVGPAAQDVASTMRVGSLGSPGGLEDLHAVRSGLRKYGQFGSTSYWGPMLSDEGGSQSPNRAHGRSEPGCMTPLAANEAYRAAAAAAATADSGPSSPPSTPTAAASTTTPAAAAAAQERMSPSAQAIPGPQTPPFSSTTTPVRTQSPQPLPHAPRAGPHLVHAASTSSMPSHLPQQPSPPASLDAQHTGLSAIQPLRAPSGPLLPQQPPPEGARGAAMPPLYVPGSGGFLACASSLVPPPMEGLWRRSVASRTPSVLFSKNDVQVTGLPPGLLSSATRAQRQHRESGSSLQHGLSGTLGPSTTSLINTTAVTAHVARTRCSNEFPRTAQGGNTPLYHVGPSSHLEPVSCATSDAAFRANAHGSVHSSTLCHSSGSGQGLGAADAGLAHGLSNPSPCRAQGTSSCSNVPEYHATCAGFRAAAGAGAQHSGRGSRGHSLDITHTPYPQGAAGEAGCRQQHAGTSHVPLLQGVTHGGEGDEGMAAFTAVLRGPPAAGQEAAGGMSRAHSQGSGGGAAAVHPGMRARQPSAGSARAALWAVGPAETTDQAAGDPLWGSCASSPFLGQQSSSALTPPSSHASPFQTSAAQMQQPLLPLAQASMSAASFSPRPSMLGNPSCQGPSPHSSSQLLQCYPGLLSMENTPQVTDEKGERARAEEALLAACRAALSNPSPALGAPGGSFGRVSMHASAYLHATAARTSGSGVTCLSSAAHGSAAADMGQQSSSCVSLGQTGLLPPRLSATGPSLAAPQRSHNISKSSSQLSQMALGGSVSAHLHATPAGAAWEQQQQQQQPCGGALHSPRSSRPLEVPCQQVPEEKEEEARCSRRSLPLRCFSEGNLARRHRLGKEQAVQHGLATPPLSTPEDMVPHWASEEAHDRRSADPQTLRVYRGGREAWALGSMPDALEEAYKAHVQGSSMGVDFAFDDEEDSGKARGSSGSNNSDEDDGGVVEFKYDMSGASRPEITLPARFRPNTVPYLPPVRNARLSKSQNLAQHTKPKGQAAWKLVKQRELSGLVAGSSGSIFSSNTSHASQRSGTHRGNSSMDLGHW